jgi:hypothetical protein
MFEMRECGDITLVEYPGVGTYNVSTKLIKRLQQEGILQTVPAKGCFPTPRGALEALRENPQIASGTQWAYQYDPVPCEVINLNIARHEDDTWEAQVILQVIGHKNLKRCIWLSNFLYDYHQLQ